jgi:hypothetical protein
MARTYWTLFGLSICGCVFSALFAILVLMIFKKGNLRKNYLIGYLVALTFAFGLSLFQLIPCIKDYKLVANDQFIEAEAVVVDFTYVHDDLDGNGETTYGKPKFYIESKNEYVVLNISNVKKGEKYVIRYYPNTKICEIIDTIE